MTIDDSAWYTSAQYEYVAISTQVGLAGRICHSQIERDISSRDHYAKVLEIGALSGRHLPCVRHSLDTWMLTDIIDHPTGTFDDQ